MNWQDEVLGQVCVKVLAGEPGLEPGLTESESAGLPLTYSPPGFRAGGVRVAMALAKRLDEVKGSERVRHCPTPGLAASIRGISRAVFAAVNSAGHRLRALPLLQPHR